MPTHFSTTIIVFGGRSFDSTGINSETYLTIVFFFSVLSLTLAQLKLQDGRSGGRGRAG